MRPAPGDRGVIGEDPQGNEIRAGEATDPGMDSEWRTEAEKVTLSVNTGNAIHRYIFAQRDPRCGNRREIINWHEAGPGSGGGYPPGQRGRGDTKSFAWQSKHRGIKAPANQKGRVHVTDYFIEGKTNQYFLYRNDHFSCVHQNLARFK